MCREEESNLLCQPLAPALFFRIALNWGKQPVDNLPSDRLLRRGVQVRREYRLISTVFIPFAKGDSLLQEHRLTLTCLLSSCVMSGVLSAHLPPGSAWLSRLFF